MTIPSRIYMLAALSSTLWSWSVNAQNELPPPAPSAVASGQNAEATPEGMEVLTSGPLHEAFADTVRYKAEPGLTVDREPPPLIEEQPPETQPEGADVVWIPGYWGWDDETNDFIWITGVFRNRPPGFRWVPGYWAPEGAKWQWVSGFWVGDDVQEVNYLPEPPATLDQGPSSPQPSANYFWNPGCWNWGGSSYAWRAGYWARCQPNWMWYPTYYNWTPRGYVCVNGRWDRPWATRGLCFAPVRYTRPLYLNSGYFYRPWVAYNTSAFAWNLFVRPGYGHYYVGNYWGNRYSNFGYRPWYSYGQRGFGYDPFYNYYRWSNGRNNPRWENDIRNRYTRMQDSDQRRSRDYNDYRNNFDRIDQRDRTAVTLDQLQRDRGDNNNPRLVDARNRDTEQMRENARQFRELNNRRRDIELAGSTSAGNRPGDNNDRGPRDRAEGAPRGQLDLPPVARTETPNLGRQRGDRNATDRGNANRGTVNNNDAVDRARRAVDQNQNRDRVSREQGELTAQQGNRSQDPRSTRSFRANPDAGANVNPGNLDANRGSSRNTRPGRVDVPQTEGRINVNPGSGAEGRARTRTPETRSRVEPSAPIRINPPSQSVPRSNPSANRSFESRSRGGGDAAARSSRSAPSRSFEAPARSAPSRSTPNFSAPRGGGGAPAARMESRGGGGGGGRSAPAGGGGGGGGGGNRGGGGEGGGGGGRGGRGR